MNTNKEYNSDNFERNNRHCPVCGDYVQKGNNLHRCDEKKLKNIERGRKAAETRLEEDGYYFTERSIEDHFSELENMVDMDYLDVEEEGFL